MALPHCSAIPADDLLYIKTDSNVTTALKNIAAKTAMPLAGNNRLEYQRVIASSRIINKLIDLSEKDASVIIASASGHSGKSIAQALDTIESHYPDIAADAAMVRQALGIKKKELKTADVPPLAVTDEKIPLAYFRREKVRNALSQIATDLRRVPHSPEFSLISDDARDAEDVFKKIKKAADGFTFELGDALDRNVVDKSMDVARHVAEIVGKERLPNLQYAIFTVDYAIKNQGRSNGITIQAGR